MCVGPSKSYRKGSDSRFKFVLASASFSLFIFTAGHALLLSSFNTGTWDETWNPSWTTENIHPENLDDLRVLNEAIVSLIFCGLTSIFLLLSSKYSKLESDRSRLQIYKGIRMEYESFKAAPPTGTLEMLEFFKTEGLPQDQELKRFFNVFFQAESLDCNPLDYIDLVDVNQKDTKETLLTKAVKVDTSLVEKMVENENLNVNETDPSGQTALTCAIHLGKSETVKCLLTSPQIDLNKLVSYKHERKKRKLSSLHIAALGTNFNICQQLLCQEGLDVNKEGEWDGTKGVSPLHVAVETGNTETIKLILSHQNIDVNKKTNGKEEVSALGKSLMLGNEKVTNLLLSHSMIEVTPADRALANQRRPKVVEQLDIEEVCHQLYFIVLRGTITCYYNLSFSGTRELPFRDK